MSSHGISAEQNLKNVQWGRWARMGESHLPGSRVPNNTNPVRSVDGCHGVRVVVYPPPREVDFVPATPLTILKTHLPSPAAAALPGGGKFISLGGGYTTTRTP